MIECGMLKTFGAAMLTILFAVFGVAEYSANCSAAAITDGPWDRWAFVTGVLSCAVFPITVGCLVGMFLLFLVLGGFPKRPYQYPPPFAVLATLGAALILHSFDVSVIVFLSVTVVFLIAALFVSGAVTNYLFIRDPESPDEIA